MIWPDRFAGKVALITGAGSGIGRAVAIRLTAEGATVLGVDVDAARLEETAATSSGRVRTRLADLSDPDECVAVVEECADRLGRIDVLGNVAGIYLAEHTTAVTRSDYHRLLAINLDAPFFTTQAAIPHLLAARGNVINIASNSALQGVPYSAAYCASKGGIVQLTKALAAEYIKTPMRVNAIAPAGTRTNIATAETFPADMDTDLVARMSGQRGLAEPEEVAGLFAYLASDEARSVTGAVYTLDNGLTAT